MTTHNLFDCILAHLNYQVTLKCICLLLLGCFLFFTLQNEMSKMELKDDHHTWDLLCSFQLSCYTHLDRNINKWAP